ncbi:MAG: hypothetical protein M3P94_02125, partial [Chloroflexota bacterium]|nr:hypothetical protein [Chloroflexota bacterium]
RDADLIALLRDQRSRHEERRRQYDGVADVIERAPATDRQRRLWHLTLANGQGREDAYLAWLDEAIDILAGDDETSPEASR